MSLRISQRQMYSNILGRMNTNLSDLMESNIQASSEKKINRPSDDPYGSAQILTTRNSLDAIKKYQSNVDSARAWLNSADGTLDSVDTVLGDLFTLAEQMAHGTYTADQRNDAGAKARGLFEQLIGLGNTKFNGAGTSIFAGHKVDQPAFVIGLGVDSRDPALAGTQFSVDGGSNNTVLVQFTAAGTIGTNTPAFRYTEDGGKTWKTDGTWTSTAPPVLQAGSVRVNMTVTAPPSQVTPVDPTNPNETNNGTWLYVRPAAIYQGDDNDAIATQNYPVGASFAGTATSKGAFSREVAVRIDDTTSTPGTIKFSYSIDDGSNWIPASTPAGPPANLPVAGGFLTLAGASPSDGDQFIIRPRRANIDLDIGTNSSITTNFVGKDVFGGLYAPPFSTNGPQPVTVPTGGNMYEAIGRFVGALETNSQAGCQNALTEIKAALVSINTTRTAAGGRINRLDSAKDQLQNLTLDESDYLSKVEDVDVSELMTRLSQQQLAYNAVLKSSSMIMQMNLMNFL